MRIIVEILNEVTNAVGEKSFNVDESKTIIISLLKNTTTIQQAKDKLLELKPTLSPSQKIRVLEYHNDDIGDRNRKPCKILFEV